MNQEEILLKIAKNNALIKLRTDIGKELEKGSSWDSIAKKFGFKTAKKLQDHLDW